MWLKDKDLIGGKVKEEGDMRTHEGRKVYSGLGGKVITHKKNKKNKKNKNKKNKN